MLKPKKGRLLISEPSLSDPTFFKSVILLTYHNSQESIGLILNQPTKIEIRDIFKEISSSEFPLYIGGPVAKNSIQFIHTLGEKINNSVEIANGIYWGGNFKEIIRLINNGKISNKDIRFFAGYSGWEANQLNQEIEENNWIISVAKKETCMQYSNHNLWSNIIKTKESKYAIWTNMPTNPHLN